MNKETLKNIKVTVEPLYNYNDMWRLARRLARKTVNKGDLISDVSEKFKKDILIPEHTPIRELRFYVSIENLPTFTAQQFSRHRIATVSGDFLHETVNPTDVEHYVRTQRTDRTEQSRGSQEAPVNYDFTANMQGLIDMSKKRMCQAAEYPARFTWSKVKQGIAEIDPMLSMFMQPSCIYRGFCPELMCECNYINTLNGQNDFKVYREYVDVKQ